STFTDDSPTSLYPLSLHDALPISTITRNELRPLRTRQVLDRAAGSADRQSLPRDAARGGRGARGRPGRLRAAEANGDQGGHPLLDRKSTRLNSSHVAISYAVFCLK